MSRTSAAWPVVTVAIAMVLANASAIAQPSTAGKVPQAPLAPQAEVVPLTAEEVVAAVEGAGYTDIDALAVEHGRYELTARDRNNFKVMLTVNPKTGDIRSRLARKRDERGRKVPVDEIVAEVEAAGFSDIYLVERAHALYEIQARDAEGHGVELFVHPKTGKLLRHPRTGALLSEEVEKILPFENILRVEEIVAAVRNAGYPTVYAIGHEASAYRIDAEDEEGRLFSLYLEPDSGRPLEASLRRWLPAPLYAGRPE